MALTKISGEVIQSGINIGIVTATRIDGDINGNVNSTGVSTFSTLKVGASVNISSGVVTATTFSGNVTGNVTGNATGLSGTPNIVVGAITASSATITGNVSVAGTVTYEDTTNVDSVGVITARSGIQINTGGINVLAGVSTFPSVAVTGVGTFGTSIGVNTTSPVSALDLSKTTNAIALPQGTTAQRPTGNNPYIRYNTTNSALEFYNGTDWVEIISDYFPSGSTILG